MVPTLINDFTSIDDFIQVATKSILKVAHDAINRSGNFRVVLSGGETPKRIYAALAEYKASTSFWQAWEIWFADERCLPTNDGQRNSRMAEDIWLGKVPVNRDKVFVIQAELGATKAAMLYHEALISVDSFDLTLLGIGVDGHTASLFPKDHQQNSIHASAIPVFDAPKAPSERVSLSLKRLNRSKQVFFLVAGQNKKHIVDNYISGVFMPASLIRGEEITQLFYTYSK